MLVGRLLTLVEVAAKGVNVKGMHDVKDIKRSPVIMKRERDNGRTERIITDREKQTYLRR